MNSSVFGGRVWLQGLHDFFFFFFLGGGGGGGGQGLGFRFYGLGAGFRRFRVGGSEPFNPQPGSVSTWPGPPGRFHSVHSQSPAVTNLGSCQGYGPCLDSYYNTAPII